MEISISLFLITPIVSISSFSTESRRPDEEQLLLASCESLAATPEQENAKSFKYFIPGLIAAAQTIAPPLINNNSQKKPEFSGSNSRPNRNSIL